VSRDEVGVRPVSTVVTLVAAGVVLIVMAAWGISAATKPLPPLGGDDSTTCSKDEISRQVYVTRKQVTVSVYNAGARKGFANLTLQRLESLGFNPGSVGNAPEGTTVTKAKVVTTQTDDAAASLVAQTLGKDTPVEVTDEDLGPGIDVFVGPKQRGLNPAAPLKVKLAHPIESCVPVK
jgi:hypothetical protein